MIGLMASAFVLGIFGSIHCMGMCGPLIMSLPFQHVSIGKVKWATLSYHLGKTTTYAFLGLLAGIIGKSFVILQWQQILSIIAGSILLLLTIVPILKNKLTLPLPIQSWFTKIYEALATKTSLKYFYLFGLVNGLLPCGLVYAALAGALATGAPLQGMLFMTFFGIGTMPSLSVVVYFQHKISPSIRKYFMRSAYVLSIFVGILLILRGLDLGIPYVSPHFNTSTQELDCCHKH